MSPRGVTQGTRNAVLARDAHQCQRCGCTVRPDFYSLQHRRPRAAGGTSLAHINEAPNLVLLCGSATTGCHGHVESHREEARRYGWSILLNAHYTPSAVPWRGMRGGNPVWFQAVNLFRMQLPDKDAIGMLVALGIREEETT